MKTRRRNRSGKEKLEERDWRAPDLPPIPTHPLVPTDSRKMELPEGCAEIAEFARTEALQFLAKDRSLTGVGLGMQYVRGICTDKFALQFLTRKKTAPRKVKSGLLLPKTVHWKGRELLVDVLEFDAEIALTGAFPSLPPMVRQTGAFTGSATSSDSTACGGTLGGVWPSLFGSGERGLTCAHVALGFGVRDLLANLPGSLSQLFQPPAGSNIIVSGGLNIGQNLFELMEIDTPWPVLVPWPFAIPVAGALGFIYVDGAAGRVQPKTFGLPNFLPPPAPPAPPKKQTITGARVGAARAPVPGTPVYKIGQSTGITWGTVMLSFLQVPIPVGPFVIIFDQILSRLDIAERDSGASLLTEHGNHYLGSCWGGLPTRRPTVIEVNVPSCGGDNLMLPHTLATPWWWLSLLMDINFL